RHVAALAAPLQDRFDVLVVRHVSERRCAGSARALASRAGRRRRRRIGRAREQKCPTQNRNRYTQMIGHSPSKPKRRSVSGALGVILIIRATPETWGIFASKTAAQLPFSSTQMCAPEAKGMIRPWASWSTGSGAT